MKSFFRPTSKLLAPLVMSLCSAAAMAQTRILINTLTADSFQTFSEDAIGAFELKNVTITARGNAQATPDAYRLPITEIYLGPSKFTGLAGGTYKGGSIGSALEITRVIKKTGQRVGLTMANFRINYHSKKVIADVTPIGGKTTLDQAIYDFQVIRPMVFEPNAQGKFVLEERLGELRLTPESVTSFTNALALDAVSVILIKALDFGTLVQSINLAPRAATSTTPYIAQ